MQKTALCEIVAILCLSAALACSSADEPGGAQGGSANSTAGASVGGAAIGGSAGAGGATGGVGGGASGSGATAAGSSGAPAAGGGGMAGMNGGTGGTGGTGGAGGIGGSSGAGGSASTGSPLPAVTDYSKAGPFMATEDTDVGPNGDYRVYRPATLGQDGFKHPPIIFGPGIGQSVTVHSAMLTNFATHGFVVVGTPVLEGRPGDPGNLKLMRDGLDWILQQNAAAGSMYQGKVDVRRAVSMGFSVGGTAAVELGSHEAVATTVSIHGHTAMSALHGPMLQTTGTNDTRGVPLQQETYDMSQVPTFLATLTGAGHTYIESAGGGEERPAILAWMRYWINGDQGAKRYFYGADCVLCKAPWENPQRKNWQ